MNNQNKLPLGSEKVEDMTFELPRPQPIRGFPELHWAGKRPFTSTHNFPAQKKESYGDPVNGWMNRIYWGDNLQVMSHLLKEFRGKVDLVYIDPPFDSKAEYKKTIASHGNRAEGNHSNFEEKQYNDIWSSDEFNQFIYERLIIIKELLSDTSSLFVHCDWHKSHHIRCIIDEVFGPNNFRNEIIWQRGNPRVNATKHFSHNTDTILFYSKTDNLFFNVLYTELSKDYIDKYYSQVCEITGKLFMPSPLIGHVGTNKEFEWKGFFRAWRYPKHRLDELEQKGLIYWPQRGDGVPRFKKFLDDTSGRAVQSLWNDINSVNSQAIEDTQYPTQKPEALLERIINASTNPGAIVLDCFMGSGTTQAVAMKLGRRFIGADINMGAIQTTTNRLNSIIAEKKSDRGSLVQTDPLYLNFEVYNVNNYDVFRNPAQAKDLLMQALEIEPLDSSEVFDGMKDGYKVKIMPVNRIATRKDLNPIITGMNYRELNAQHEKTPNAVLDKIMLVCMGHEPDLEANLKMEIGKQYELDIKIVDIFHKKELGLTFKYDPEAEIGIEEDELVIKQFFPRNLLQKLSLLEENVEDWRELVESVAIDWNYNGEVLRPAIFDCPGKNELVQGRYKLPPDYGLIRVKITDLLSESLEANIEAEE